MYIYLLNYLPLLLQLARVESLSQLHLQGEEGQLSAKCWPTFCGHQNQ